MSSKFLVDEYHLFYSPSLSAKVGRSAALILQRTYYWMGIKGGKTISGIKWFYKTYENWASELCLSVSTVRRAIASLKRQGLIQVKRLSADTWYQANWYTINFASVEALFTEQVDVVQYEQVDEAITTESICSERADFNNKYNSYQSSSVSFSPEESGKKNEEENQLDNTIHPKTTEDISTTPETTVKVNSVDQSSTLEKPVVEKPVKRKKEEWEIEPGVPFPVLVNWWAYTNYKEQDGHWSKGAYSHARAHLYKDRQHTTTAIFPMFLAESTLIVENCNQQLAASMKATLPSYFIVPPEATEENVQQLMKNIYQLVEKGVGVALPQGIATPSCNQSMSFAQAQNRAIAPLKQMPTTEQPPQIQAIIRYLESGNEPAARAIALRHNIDITAIKAT